MSNSTKALLLLFRAANMAVIALCASAVTLLVTGFGVEGTKPLWPWFLLAFVAMLAFRYTFFKSLQRDHNASDGEAESVEKAK